MAPRLSEVLIAALVVTVATSLFAADETPSFRTYPAVGSAMIQSPAPVDTSSSAKARQYRSVLTAAAAAGPNFAGRFTFVAWGCGVACQEFALVEVESGRVHFPKSVRLNAYQAVTDGTAPFQYRVDSRLFILTGAPNDGNETGIYYYEWTGEDLRLISRVSKTWPR